MTSKIEQDSPMISKSKTVGIRKNTKLFDSDVDLLNKKKERQSVGIIRRASKTLLNVNLDRPLTRGSAKVVPSSKKEQIREKWKVRPSSFMDPEELPRFQEKLDFSKKSVLSERTVVPSIVEETKDLSSSSNSSSSELDES